jgi:glycosyltransferase involved in cell wall biosynthesis
MITVYLENVWPEIITKRGMDLFKRNNIAIKSDLMGNSQKEAIDSDLLVITRPTFDISRHFSEKKPIIFYALFPDWITGWSFRLNKYKKGLCHGFEKNLDKANIVLANSQYTKKLILSRLKKPREIEVCKLGIDYKSIDRLTKKRSQRAKIKVLWNHMWRTDKGFLEALNIVYRLAAKFPKTDFLIGRKEDWGQHDLFKLRKSYRSFLSKIQRNNFKNIMFLNLFDNQKDYWKFLGTVDIGFSCSAHETFGLSMLEQAAAGIACVVPNAEAYPEILKGAIKVPPKKIEKTIARLIMDKDWREKISIAGKKSAAAYDIEHFVNQFSKNISDVVINKQ